MGEYGSNAKYHFDNRPDKPLKIKYEQSRTHQFIDGKMRYH